MHKFQKGDLVVYYNPYQVHIGIVRWIFDKDNFFPDKFYYFTRKNDKRIQEIIDATGSCYLINDSMIFLEEELHKPTYEEFEIYLKGTIMESLSNIIVNYDYKPNEGA